MKRGHLDAGAQVQQQSHSALQQIASVGSACLFPLLLRMSWPGLYPVCTSPRSNATSIASTSPAPRSRAGAPAPLMWEGCSCSLEREHGSAPVRRVRLRLVHGHHGREEPARNAYLAALVGPLAPGSMVCSGCNRRCGPLLRSSKTAPRSRTRTASGSVRALLRNVAAGAPDLESSKARRFRECWSAGVRCSCVGSPLQGQPSATVRTGTASERAGASLHLSGFWRPAALPSHTSRLQRHWQTRAVTTAGPGTSSGRARASLRYSAAGTRRLSAVCHSNRHGGVLALLPLQF